MKNVKLSNLKEGDLFEYNGTLYEVCVKGKWESRCKYINDHYEQGGWFASKYLYCSFSNYTKVSV